MGDRSERLDWIRFHLDLEPPHTASVLYYIDSIADTGLDRGDQGDWDSHSDWIPDWIPIPDSRLPFFMHDDSMRESCMHVNVENGIQSITVIYLYFLHEI